MKLIEHISRLDMILRHSRMSKDSRLSFPFLMHLWNARRASHVRESYRANGEYDTSLFQDLAAVPVTQRSLQDDPGFPQSCMNMGKLHIPAVVALMNDAGVVSVSSLSKEQPYFPCGIGELSQRMRLENYKNERWYARLGTTIWVYPYAKEVNVVAILDDPLEGWILNTEKPVNGELIARTEYNLGESYKVTGGQIFHDGVNYTLNDVFEATLPTWTGNGTIEFVNKKRKLTIDDPYPMSATMADIITIQILTQDFKLEKAEIADIRNNMKDDAQLVV